jgi:hypothetical protein
MVIYIPNLNLFKTALTIRNKYLKYSMNKKYDFIEEIIQSINEIKINEAELIQKLLFSI